MNLKFQTGLRQIVRKNRRPAVKGDPDGGGALSPEARVFIYSGRVQSKQFHITREPRRQFTLYPRTNAYNNAKASIFNNIHNPMVH